MCLLLLVSAVAFAWKRSREANSVGIDFVQFRLTGSFINAHPGTHVYSSEGRQEILEAAWSAAQSEQGTKLFAAVHFRHSRSWETYSSPFLYSVFAIQGLREQVVQSRESNEKNRDGTAAQYDWELGIYHGICVASTVVGVLCFGWVLRVPWIACLLAAATIVWFSPLRIDLNVANVNQIQLGMAGVLAVIVGRAASGQRSGPRADSWLMTAESSATRAMPDTARLNDYCGGVWLGLCLAFKPSLLWVAVMWILFTIAQALRHRGDSAFRSGCHSLICIAAGGLTGAVLAIAFSLFWFPLSAWFDWVEAVRSMPDDIIRTSQGNFSPTYYAQHSLGLPVWLLMLAGPCLTLASAFVMSDFRRKGAPHQGPVDSANGVSQVVPWIIAGLQIHLLTSHLVWYHYCVLSLPAVLWVLHLASQCRDNVVRALTVVIGLWCLLLLGLGPLDAWIGSSQEERCLRCFCANLLLLLMTIVPVPQSASGNTAIP
jgi:hypothetical protein